MNKGLVIFRVYVTHTRAGCVTLRTYWVIVDSFSVRYQTILLRE